MKKNNNKNSAKYTRLFYGDNVPVLQEVEMQYHQLPYESLIELAKQYMNDNEKENLQEVANEFCKYDCEGSYDNMTDLQKVIHYIHSKYRSNIIIQLEQQYEQENNITVKAHPSIEARKQVKKFFETLECETV